MSTTTGLSYDSVFNLAVQLPLEERERFLRELPNGTLPKPQEEEPSRLTDEYIEQYGVPMGDGFVMVTVPGKPLVSREEIEEIKRIGERRQRRRSPEELEKSRQRLLEILLNCPVMTDEELQGIVDARKEINECRLAYL